MTENHEPRLVLATHNAHKLTELRQILCQEIAGFTPRMLLGATELGAASPVEDGTTFAENSLLKARALAQQSNLPAIADDSGITVDILGGAPGIFSARWCGRHGDDRANLELLLQQLAEVRDDARGAAFVAAASLVLPDGREFVCEGVVRGTLRRAPAGSSGFGYDPIFQPDGYAVTTAQLSAAEKNLISHRGKAFRSLAPQIASCLGLT